MFFLTFFRENKAKKLIPSKWVKNLNIAELLNYGVTYHKKKLYTVFYSPLISDEPDFTLKEKPAMDEKRGASYKAYILKAFGK